ncbi:MAG: hypothetical protein WBD95_06685 [Xanthobacteraceae bacterium]
MTIATNRYLTISFCLAVALFGDLLNTACVAEEAGAGNGASERGTMSGSETAARNTPNPGAQSVPAAGGDAVKSSTGDGAPKEMSVGGNAEGIDTRITVPPRRSGGGRDKIAGPKAVELVAPRNLLAHRPGVPSGANPVVRNAVGAVVIRHEGFEQHNGERAPVVVPSSISATSNSTGGAIGKVTKPQGSFERPTTNSNLIVRPVVVNRSAVNGTSLIRPGSAPSGIGGPAKTVAGINGTTIRSPH